MATPPPYIYTLSLHDALPIFLHRLLVGEQRAARVPGQRALAQHVERAVALADPSHAVVDATRAEPLLRDRKSTRLNSSHPSISYAVFCLKKKKNKAPATPRSQ